MNYLTNYYKNLSEQLQARVKYLQKLLSEGSGGLAKDEMGPPKMLNYDRLSDDELEERKKLLLVARELEKKLPNTGTPGPNRDRIVEISDRAFQKGRGRTHVDPRVADFYNRLAYEDMGKPKLV